MSVWRHAVGQGGQASTADTFCGAAAGWGGCVGTHGFPELDGGGVCCVVSLCWKPQPWAELPNESPKLQASEASDHGLCEKLWAQLPSLGLEPQDSESGSPGRRGELNR